MSKEVLIKKTNYHFKTVFAIRSPLPKVWDAMLDYRMWPKWWKGLQDIQVKKDDDAHLDRTLACNVGFALYFLKFTLQLDKFVPKKTLHILSSGDLEGKGVFTFSEDHEVTTVQFIWDVETTKSWMNILTPIAKPIFRYEHNVIMGWFAKGLAAYLQAPLLFVKNF